MSSCKTGQWKCVRHALKSLEGITVESDRWFFIEGSNFMLLPLKKKKSILQLLHGLDRWITDTCFHVIAHNCYRSLTITKKFFYIILLLTIAGDPQGSSTMNF